MISIAICDDDSKDAKLLYKGLTSFLMQYGYRDFKIDCYETIEELSLFIHHYQILFLDIHLGSDNGIVYAKQLREQGNDISIIIVSSSTEYLKEGYHIKALRYITKPYTNDELAYEMREVYSDLKKQKAYISLPQLSIDKLYIKDIIYIEVFQHITELHTTFGVYKLRLSLKEWEAILSAYPFSKSSKSFLVHFLHVKKINQSEVVLQNEQKCPLSRRYRKMFLQDYYQHMANS